MRQELLFKNYKDRHYCIFEAGSGGNGAMHFHRDKMIGRLIDYPEISILTFDIFFSYLNCKPQKLTVVRTGVMAV